MTFNIIKKITKNNYSGAAIFLIKKAQTKDMCNNGNVYLNVVCNCNL